jgi:hypothetical protein
MFQTTNQSSFWSLNPHSLVGYTPTPMVHHPICPTCEVSRERPVGVPRPGWMEDFLHHQKDERNPINNGKNDSQLVQDLFHPQYYWIIELYLHG